MQRFVLMLALLVAAGGVRVMGQGSKFDPDKVPATGSRIEDFIPAGFESATQVKGDLDGDGIADVVLELVPTGYDSEGVVSAPEAHGLVIVLKQRDGRLKRGGVAARLLAIDEPQAIVTMKIKDGVLIVDQNYGMTQVTDSTHRIRYNPKAARFVLIGRDIYSYHRPQGPEWPGVLVSENYITGLKVTTTDHWTRGGTNRPTKKTGKVARFQTLLEEIDERVE